MSDTGNTVNYNINFGNEPMKLWTPTGEPEESVSSKALTVAKGGGSHGGHDPRANKDPVKRSVRKFGQWASGRFTRCVHRLSKHPELVARGGGNVNRLCAWLKDQWAHTTKWRTGNKKNLRNRAIKAAKESGSDVVFHPMQPDWWKPKYGDFKEFTTELGDFFQGIMDWEAENGVEPGFEKDDAPAPEWDDIEDPGEEYELDDWDDLEDGDVDDTDDDYLGKAQLTDPAALSTGELTPTDADSQPALATQSSEGASKEPGCCGDDDFASMSEAEQSQEVIKGQLQNLLTLRAKKVNSDLAAQGYGNGSDYTYCYIIATYPDYVIYCEDGDTSGTYWWQDYSVDDEGDAILEGEPRKVIQSWEDVPGAQDAQDAADDAGDGDSYESDDDSVVEPSDGDSVPDGDSAGDQRGSQAGAPAQAVIDGHYWIPVQGPKGTVMALVHKATNRIVRGPRNLVGAKLPPLPRKVALKVAAQEAAAKKKAKPKTGAVGSSGQFNWGDCMKAQIKAGKKFPQATAECGKLQKAAGNSKTGPAKETTESTINGERRVEVRKTCVGDICLVRGAELPAREAYTDAQWTRSQLMVGFDDPHLAILEPDGSANTRGMAEAARWLNQNPLGIEEGLRKRMQRKLANIYVRTDMKLPECLEAYNGTVRDPAESAGEGERTESIRDETVSERPSSKEDQLNSLSENDQAEGLLDGTSEASRTDDLGQAKDEGREGNQSEGNQSGAVNESGNEGQGDSGTEVSVELYESAPVQTVNIYETSRPGLGFEIVAEAAKGQDTVAPSGKKYDAKIRVIAPGPGNPADGFYYTPEVIAKDIKVLAEGKKMYEDHDTPEEERKRGGRPRSPRDWMAVCEEAWSENGIGYGGITFVDEAFEKKARKGYKYLGVSIRASAKVKPGRVNGKPYRVVESFVQGKSVDFVTEAGAGGGFEAIAESNREDTMPSIDLDALTPEQILEALQEQAPEVLDKHREAVEATLLDDSGVEHEDEDKDDKPEGSGESTESDKPEYVTMEKLAELLEAAKKEGREESEKTTSKAIQMGKNRARLETLLTGSGLRPASAAIVREAMADAYFEPTDEKSAEEMYEAAAVEAIEAKKQELAEYLSLGTRVRGMGPGRQITKQGDGEGATEKGDGEVTEGWGSNGAGPVDSHINAVLGISPKSPAAA